MAVQRRPDYLAKLMQQHTMPLGVRNMLLQSFTMTHNALLAAAANMYRASNPDSPSIVEPSTPEEEKAMFDKMEGLQQMYADLVRAYFADLLVLTENATVETEKEARLRGGKKDLGN